MLSIFANAFFIATRTEASRPTVPTPAEETSRRRFPRLSAKTEPTPAA